jgi:hypothetical protein
LHDLFYCRLVFFTCFSHFYFCVKIKHCVFLWRLWLQLNDKANKTGSVYINAILWCIRVTIVAVTKQ